MGKPSDTRDAAYLGVLRKRLPAEFVGVGFGLITPASPKTKESRAFRLLAEAKARHPEWVVKRLTPVV